MAKKEKVVLPEVVLPAPRRKKRKKLKIQSLEEYIVDNNIPVLKPDISRFPDLFGVKLSKDKRDDMTSKTPALEGTPGINLYTALLVANDARYYQELKAATEPVATDKKTDSKKGEDND